MEYILSSFWTWLGTVILLYLALELLEIVLNAISSRRKVKVSQRGDTITVEITNASRRDVEMALWDVSQNADIVPRAQDNID